MTSVNASELPTSAAIVIDRKGYIVGWNEGAEAVLGFAEKDVVGRACHHVLCGRDPEGRLVCHPWCAMSPEHESANPGDDLVLYPRSSARNVVEVTLNVFRVEVEDATRGWVVHLITSAKPLPATPRASRRADRAWTTRRQTKRRKPPNVDQH